MGRTLLVTDLDGTLLRNDKTLSPATVETINRFIGGGGLMTYATARSFHSASRLVRPLPFHLPAITFNGAFIVDPADGTRLHQSTLDKEALAPHILRLHAEGRCPMVYAFIDGHERVSWIPAFMTDGVRRYVDSRQGDPRLRLVTEPERLMDGDVFYVTLIGEEGPIRAAEPALRGVPSVRMHLLEDSYTPGEFWLEISNDMGGKDAAVRRLRTMLSVERVICFGDNLNDIPLFEAGDEGYAVENAQPALRAIATGTLASNEEDGVARFLQAHMENGGGL